MFVRFKGAIQLELFLAFRVGNSCFGIGRAAAKAIASRLDGAGPDSGPGTTDLAAIARTRLPWGHIVAACPGKATLSARPRFTIRSRGRGRPGRAFRNGDAGFGSGNALLHP